MKHANKLMVVPYISKIDRQTDKYLIELDNNMSQVLTNQNLSVDQKIKLYNQTLQRFLINYTPLTEPLINKAAY